MTNKNVLHNIEFPIKYVYSRINAIFIIILNENICVYILKKEKELYLKNMKGIDFC